MFFSKNYKSRPAAQLLVEEIREPVQAFLQPRPVERVRRHDLPRVRLDLVQRQPLCHVDGRQRMCLVHLIREDEELETKNTAIVSNHRALPIPPRRINGVPDNLKVENPLNHSTNRTSYLRGKCCRGALQ